MTDVTKLPELSATFNVDAFKDILKIFEDAVEKDHIQLDFKENGIRATHVDTQHVMLVDAVLEIEDNDNKNIPREWIDEGIVLDLETLRPKIKYIKTPRRRDLKKGYKWAKRESNITLTVEDGQAHFTHPSIEFWKNLLDCYSEAKVPQWDREAHVSARINTMQLHRFLKMAQLESNHIRYKANKEKNKLIAVYEGEAGEKTITDLTYSLGGIEGIDLTFNDLVNIEAIFNAEYLYDFLDALDKRKVPIIDIYLTDDFPVIMKWEQKYISGQMLLAPRIDYG